MGLGDGKARERIDVSAFVHETVMPEQGRRRALAGYLAPRRNGVTAASSSTAPSAAAATPKESSRRSATARVIARPRRDDVALAAARGGSPASAIRHLRETAFADVCLPRSPSSSLSEVDGLCADLGVSSPQLDDAARGMSFPRSPLDMYA